MSSLNKKHKHKAIQVSDPGKILDLVMSLNDVTCADLQVKINNYLIEECEAELVFGVIVHGERKEAYIETILRTTLNKKTKINVSQHWTEVIKSGMESVHYFGNCAEDVRTIIAPYLQKENAHKKRVVVQPISGKPFSLLMFVVAPKELQERVVSLISECFLFCWPTVKKTIWYEYECSLKQKCQQLLKIAKRLFSQVATLDQLLQLTMEQAKHLIRAQYCTVRLVDVDKMELVEASQSAKGGDAEEKKERRFPMDKGISGYVLQTGNVVNAKCVEDHPAYSPLVDNVPGVEIKTLLCFPIREQAGIIGVGMLINKIGEPYFDAMDEEMALAFSIYCGVCIIHSVVYQKIREAHIRNTLANELVMYHMKVADSEVEKLLSCTGYHSHPHFQSLHFNHRALPMRELTCYALKMFVDLGFIQRFDLKRHKLARFILHVKKGYRDVPYHNWLHGFNVAQWAYAALVNYRLVLHGYFSDLQAFMFLIAGFTHDLDHRGTTNSFHIQGQTTLAALYSSEGSVMERHHLAQAMCILNTEGCDILEKLPRRDYDKALVLLRDFVLASDLSNYFKNLTEYKAISLEYLKGNRVHMNALQSLLMNAADLSDQLKDWGSVKKTAAAVLTEFFQQGDVEKSRGDLPPIIMDREKCFIPELEIQFLQATCVPLYEMLGRILPKAAPCTKIIENHIERWDGAKPIFAEVPTTGGLAVLLSPELDILIEANLLERARQAREAEAEAAAAAAAAAAEAEEEENKK